jgi:heme oxygenase
MNSKLALKSTREAVRTLEGRMTVLTEQLAREGEIYNAEVVEVAYEWLRNVDMLLENVRLEPLELELEDDENNDDSEVLAWIAS